MLTVGMVELDLDSFVHVCVLVVLINFWPCSRHSVHQIQIQFIASATRSHFDCSCQACIAFRSPGCRY